LARAKRTDRTEARRRNRAEHAAAPGTATGSAAATTTPAGGASKSAPAPERPSITNAFRSSFRAVDLRADLRALPRLVIHWSFWGPVLASVITSVLYIVLARGRTETSPSDTMWVVVNLAFQMFVFPLPAPAGASFIAGFFAQRASWLVGLLIGVIASICFAVVVYAVPPSVSSTGSTASIQALALQGFLVAPIGSALFASAAAWYKRFLNTANPNRNQRKPTQQRPGQGRGDITRDRLSH
jgi:hypothetical protein